jgi:NADH-quinone oxidoreductase subunit L
MVTAGVYLLTRTAFLFALTPDVLALVAWVGAGTALMAAILACAQTTSSACSRIRRCRSSAT